MMADAKVDDSTTGEDELAPENRRALEWLEQDSSEQDDVSEEWWDEFEDFLRTHRLKIGIADDEA
jgi:hypothetical protein